MQHDICIIMFMIYIVNLMHDSYDVTAIMYSIQINGIFIQSIGRIVENTETVHNIEAR